MATGRKQVAPRQTIASQWGNEVWDQSVQTFATIADRNTQFPTPKRGAVCMLDSHPGILMLFDGANWIGRQELFVNVTTNGSGEVIVNFPYAFTGGTPVVNLSTGNASADWMHLATMKSGYPNAAGFIICVSAIRTNVANAPAASAGVALHWTARGRF